MNDKNPNPQHCPLCEGDNQCAIAAGKPAEQCWCMTTTIDKQTLQQATLGLPQRCLCPSCCRGAQAVC